MIELIDSLRQQKFFVTMYDMGKNKLDFVLAVIVDEPIEIWYVSRVMHDVGIPMLDGRLLYFPVMKINAETYEYLCA
jgi:hypothetical protein